MNIVPTDSLGRALERLFQRTAHGIRPGLEIINRLLDLMGHPEKAYPSVHAAGTNGKGSVCALIESVLRHANYKTGLYTSPHLVRFNERIQVGGEPITDRDLAELINLIDPLAAQVDGQAAPRPATFFEMSTAMAFECFKRAAVEWAVIETGMGGRWDATNVVTPAVSVITRIDIDHVNFLGADIKSIAEEKAGIIKPGVPVVCGSMAPAAEAIVLGAARAAGSTVVRADEVIRIQRIDQDWLGQKIKVETDQRSLRSLRLPLIGRHQIENCALAVATLETLEALGHVTISDEALRAGLAECRWPARCQVLEREPLVLLDVAHNPSGAAALVHTLEENGRGQPVGLVTGFLQDKDALGCLEVFSRIVKQCWAVSIADERGMSAEDVRACAVRAGLKAEAASLKDALDEARAWAARENGIVCIAGSLYLAGEVLQAQ